MTPEQIISEHGGLIRLALRHVNAPPHVQPDDLEQVGMMALHRCAITPKYNKDRVRFGTYAYKAIRNAMLSEIRRTPAWGQDQAEEHADDEERTLPFVDLSPLPPVERSLIEAMYGLTGEAMTCTAAATKLGLTPRYAKTLHQHALDRLRKVVARPDGV